MPLMAGKQVLIMGVANERSLAWGIAKTLHAHGAALAFTYQGEALGRRVRPLAQSLESNFVLEADVTSEASLDAVFAALAKRWGRLDFVVHAIAFADPTSLKGKYLETARDNFLRTLEISCYSFTDICRPAPKFPNIRSTKMNPARMADCSLPIRLEASTNTITASPSIAPRDPVR